MREIPMPLAPDPAWLSGFRASLERADLAPATVAGYLSASSASFVPPETSCSTRTSRVSRRCSAATSRRTAATSMRPGSGSQSSRRSSHDGPKGRPVDRPMTLREIRYRTFCRGCSFHSTLSRGSLASPVAFAMANPSDSVYVADFPSRIAAGRQLRSSSNGKSGINGSG